MIKYSGENSNRVQHDMTLNEKENKGEREREKERPFRFEVWLGSCFAD